MGDQKPTVLKPSLATTIHLSLYEALWQTLAPGRGQPYVSARVGRIWTGLHYVSERSVGRGTPSHHLLRPHAQDHCPHTRI